MKKVALAAAFAAVASTAYAGNYEVVVVEPEVVVEETAASSAGGVLVPLLFLTFLAVALTD